ncbi:unnamed protein product [Mytilus coruscus]|uniref:Uncharacterized protein n=1 Tax=Mytilus coruscus TaxID=42192 RepID=A0A6J8A7M3_MYTCO|nr:unnamed protein product [Mytilus coruscus]
MCYTGNHKLCRRHSFACKGGKKLWLKNSSFLNSMFKILNTIENINEIGKCILYLLGPDALNKTKLNLNTQKVEGLNRNLRRSLPKNVTVTKNFEGRVHAAVHSVNLGPGESLMLIREQLGAQVTAGSSVEQSLKSIQRTDKLQKEHKKSLKYKNHFIREYLYKAYVIEKETRNYEKKNVYPTPTRKLLEKNKNMVTGR